MCNACTHLTTKQMQTSPSLAFLVPSLCLYCFPRKLGRAIWPGLLPRAIWPSGPAVYLCCLLCATAALTLSTEWNCFSTGTTAARQVCSKHPLMKSLFAESLIDVLVHRRTATTALPQLLSDTAMPRLSLPALRISASNGFKTRLACSAGVRLRLLNQMRLWCEGSSVEEPDR